MLQWTKIHTPYSHLASDLLSLTTFGNLYTIRSSNLGLGAVVDLPVILWIAVRPSSPDMLQNKSVWAAASSACFLAADEYVVLDAVVLSVGYDSNLESIMTANFTHSWREFEHKCCFSFSCALMRQLSKSVCFDLDLLKAIESGCGDVLLFLRSSGVSTLAIYVPMDVCVVSSIVSSASITNFFVLRQNR